MFLVFKNNKSNIIILLNSTDLKDSFDLNEINIFF